MKDKKLFEEYGDLKIIARSTKKPNGYVAYYWCQCSCGNYIRYRYDQIRKKQSCGLCEDFRESMKHPHGKE